MRHYIQRNVRVAMSLGGGTPFQTLDDSINPAPRPVGCGSRSCAIFATFGLQMSPVFDDSSSIQKCRAPRAHLSRQAQSNSAEVAASETGGRRAEHNKDQTLEKVSFQIASDYGSGSRPYKGPFLTSPEKAKNRGINFSQKNLLDTNRLPLAAYGLT